ncbi:MAG: hypothetical protein GY730_04175 [bacterium]|nr:hypothetical protein [bacterium]
MKQIKKIKWNKDNGSIKIKWNVPQNTGEPYEYSLNIREKARPEFYLSLQKLAKHWSEILEIEHKDNVLVSSVSFSWSHDVMGVTIYASRKLNKSTGVFGCNTPHRIETFYSENGGDEGQLMSEDLSNDCIELLSEAKYYIDGERAQQTIFNLTRLDKKKYEDCTAGEQLLKESFSSELVRERAIENGLLKV